MQKEIFTVSEINSYIKKLLQQDTRLNGVLVRGEISNFTRHSSGHLYFSLKELLMRSVCGILSLSVMEAK